MKTYAIPRKYKTGTYRVHDFWVNLIIEFYVTVYYNIDYVYLTNV